MTQRIAVDVDKGGLGKTTITFLLVWYLYCYGKRVLAIGMDTNQGLTKMFMRKRYNAHSVGKMNNQDLIENPSLDWRTAIIHLDAKGDKLAAAQASMPADLRHPGGRLDLITESRELADAYVNFRPTGHVGTLVGALPYVVDQIALSGEYDYIVIDNAPGWDPIAKSVLYASRYVIVPVEPAPLSVESLEEYVERVDKSNSQRKEAGLHSTTQFLGVLLNRVKANMELQRELATGLPAALKHANLPTFYQEPAKQNVLMIPETNAVLASSVTGLPAWANDPSDPGAQGFLTLGRGVIHQLG